MASKSGTSRRKVLLGGLTLGALGAAAYARPKIIGQNHKPYFKEMGEALDRARFAQPTLVLDKTLLEQNIAQLSKHIGSQFDYRIVAKSLPSIPLLKTVMKGAGTQRLMLFHQPFLSQVARHLPQADVLMGKPLPVASAENFYRALSKDSSFDHASQLQWLLDTPTRVRQYQSLAQRLGITMKINIELDVGLHRGGVNQADELKAMLSVIEADPALSLSGFMGYEPHVAKLPGDKMASRDKAMKVYSEMLAVARDVTGRNLDDLTLNGAGSPTYRLYNNAAVPINELSAGSCLVKPSDFDTPELADHRPAAFIATPVIKALDHLELPGPAGVGKLMTLWNPNRQKTFFTYGGYWKANAASPEGLSLNPLFGRSSNQEMYNGSKHIDLKADDWVFLRPTQSESVFLQFGEIAVYEQGEIVDRWPVLSETLGAA